MTTLKDIRFGVEIETVRRSKFKIATAIGKFLKERLGEPIHKTRLDNGNYRIDMPDGRAWNVVSDGSLTGNCSGHAAEVVSPILTYSEIVLLQDVVRAVKQAGARVDHSCGVHVHIDAAAFDGRALRNLIKMVNKQQALIERALRIPQRRIRYCRGVNQTFLQRIEKMRRINNTQLADAWYEVHGDSSSWARRRKYNSSRYHGVNLHSVWFRGSIEFRWFNGSLHAGKIKSYIQFCLALGAKAINMRSAASARREFHTESAKYDFRCFLLSLDMIGKEFKTARLHLLKHLDGNSAWKHGRPSRDDDSTTTQEADVPASDIAIDRIMTQLGYGTTGTATTITIPASAINASSSDTN